MKAEGDISTLKGQHQNQGMDFKPNRPLMCLGYGWAETKACGAAREKGRAGAAAPVPSGPHRDHDPPLCHPT